MHVVQTTLPIEDLSLNKAPALSCSTLEQFAVELHIDVVAFAVRWGCCGQY